MPVNTISPWALYIIPLGSFITPFLGTAVNIALPDVGREFHADPVTLGWVTTAYFVAAGILTLPVSRLGDQFGRRGFYLAGLLLVSGSGLFASLVNGIPLLILLRVVQGIGGALVFGTANAIIASAFPLEKRGRAFGINTMSVYLGMSCGPFFGGIMVHHWGWRSIFLFSALVGLSTLALFQRFVKGEWGGNAAQKFDTKGSLLFALALSALMLGSSNNGQASGLLLLVGAVLLVVFLRWEDQVSNPLLDSRMLWSNRALRYATLSALIFYSSTFALVFLVSVFLQIGQGMDAQSAGFIMLAQPLAQALGSPIAGRLSDKYNPGLLTSIGVGLTSVGMLSLGLLDHLSPTIQILGGLGLAGAGIAFFAAPNVHAMMNAVQPNLFGAATGILQTVRICGQMFSMAVVLAVFSFTLGKTEAIYAVSPEQLDQVMGLVLLPLSLLCLCAMVLCVRRPDHDLSKH